MLRYSLGELVDKLVVVHNKIWHIEEEIDRLVKNGSEAAIIKPFLEQVATLNKLRVNIVSSIDELSEGMRKQ